MFLENFFLGFKFEFHESHLRLYLFIYVTYNRWQHRGCEQFGKNLPPNNSTPRTVGFFEPTVLISSSRPPKLSSPPSSQCGVWFFLVLCIIAIFCRRRAFLPSSDSRCSQGSPLPCSAQNKAVLLFSHAVVSLSNPHPPSPRFYSVPSPCFFFFSFVSAHISSPSAAAPSFRFRHTQL